MVSDGFTTGLSLATTSPASIAARARARLSNSPRSTRSRSIRLRGEDMLGSSSWRADAVSERAEPLRSHGNAKLERGQVVPDIFWPLAWQHQRCAMQVE